MRGWAVLLRERTARYQGGDNVSAGEKREAVVREALRQKARNRACNRRMKMRKTARREVRGDEQGYGEVKEARPARERVKVREALQGQGTGKENPNPQGPGQNFSPVPLQAAFDRPHSDPAAAEAHPKAAEAPKQDMGTGPDSQQNQADGGNCGVSVTPFQLISRINSQAAS